MVKRSQNKTANKYLIDSILTDNQVEKIIKNYIYNKSISVIAHRANVSKTTVQDKIKLIDKRIAELKLLEKRVIQLGSARSEYKNAREMHFNFKSRQCDLAYKRLQRKRHIVLPKPNMKTMMKCKDVKFQATASIMATTVALEYAYKQKQGITASTLATAHYEAGIIFTNGIRASGVLNRKLDPLKHKIARQRIYEYFLRRFCPLTPAEYWSKNAERYYELIAKPIDGKKNDHTKHYQYRIKMRDRKVIL